MKRFTVIAAILLLPFGLLAQSQRLVLLEHFTQASCGPCAGANPTIHNMLVANPEKITSINYHTSWPGVDPMYNHNKDDNNSRTSYYNVNGVPNSVIDGNFFNGYPTWNMTQVNQRYAVPSPADLKVFQRLSPNNDTIYVTMLIEPTQELTGQAIAMMAVIEKHIHFNTPPGSNGEKDFYNVMKKLLPSKSGLSLPTPLNPGDYVIIESAWALANVYNIDQLSVVAFIQNPLNKEVYQACNLTEGDFVAIYDNDVELLSLPGASDHYCMETLSPVVKIRNNGNNPLTSLTLKYQVNDGETYTYEWTGNLGTLGIANIQLPAFEYELANENTFKVWASSVNGSADEYTKNDMIEHEFASALQSQRKVTVKVRTDNKPEETTWEIRNDAGQVVASGGPYTQANKVINTDVTLEADGCYEFFVYDSGNNGICCTNGAGFVRLISGDETLVLGTDFGSMLTTQFDVLSVGTSLIPSKGGFNIYPNPATDQVFIEYTPERDSDVSISIVNQLGQVVFSSRETAASNVMQKTKVDTGNWPAGIYMILIDNGSTQTSHKLNISR